MPNHLFYGIGLSFTAAMGLAAASAAFDESLLLIPALIFAAIAIYLIQRVPE